MPKCTTAQRLLVWTAEACKYFSPVLLGDYQTHSPSLEEVEAVGPRKWQPRLIGVPLEQALKCVRTMIAQVYSQTGMTCSYSNLVVHVKRRHF